MVILKFFHFGSVRRLSRLFLRVHVRQPEEFPFGESVICIHPEESGRKPFRYSVNPFSIRMVSHLFVEVDQALFVKRLFEDISNSIAESLLLFSYPSPFCEEHSLSTEAQEVLTSSFHAFHSMKNLAGELVSDF